MPSKPKPWYVTRSKDVRARSWLHLRDMWIQNMPLDRPAVVVPESAVEELPSLAAEARLAAAATPPRRFAAEIDGLRTGLLVEGLTLSHKAANVLAASQASLEEGFKTWSVVASYQAGFFAARSICALLGVAIAQIEQKVFLVDVHALPEKSLRSPNPQALVYHAPNARPPVPHRPIWHLLLRSLRVIEIPHEIWPPEWVASVASHGEDDFARTRNLILYRAHGWLFDDLHTPIRNDGFACFSDAEGVMRSASDSDSDEFTLAFACVLVQLATRLVQDLASESGALTHDLAALDGWRNVESSWRFREAMA